MKRKVLLFTLLAVGFIFYSCDKNDIEFKENFKDSKKVWLDFKKQSNDSYKYTTQGSSWTGNMWQTTITVSKGKIIKRDFKYIRGENIPTNELEWTENERDINTHIGTNASDALTLKEIYEKAEEDWLVKREKSKPYFEAKNNGMISLCGYTPEGCMDDCFKGVRINSIEALK